jgi:hypothetical protein
MTSKQYEELCRFFLASQLGLGVDQILSLDLESPVRPGMPEYAHQIDLYWEIEDDVSKIISIANAKWRQTSKLLELQDVLLLQKVRELAKAHKAVLITNVGFSEGAQAAARNEEIGLHIIRPLFRCDRLHCDDPVILQSQLRDLARMAGARPIYLHEIVHKGGGLGGTPAAAPPAPAAQPPSPMPAPPLTKSLSSGPAAGLPLPYLTKTISGAVPLRPAQQGQPGGSGPRPGGSFRFLTKGSPGTARE